MKNRFRKIIGVVLSIMVVCSAFGIYASANNSYKSPYNFVLPTSGEYRFTSPRPKNDDSLVYVKLNTGSSSGAYFRAFGTQYTSSPYYEVDLSYNTLLLYPGQEDYIYQNIYDAGYYYAMLGGKNAGSATYSVSGEWSPDSDRYY